MMTCRKCGRCGRSQFDSFFGIEGVYCSNVGACRKRREAAERKSATDLTPPDSGPVSGAPDTNSP